VVGGCGLEISDDLVVKGEEEHIDSKLILLDTDLDGFVVVGEGDVAEEDVGLHILPIHVTVKLPRNREGSFDATLPAALGVNHFLVDRQ